MKAKTALIASIATVGIAGTARADFSGAYAPGNWTLTTNGGTGGAVNNGTSLVLTGTNGGVGIDTDYTITAAATGMMAFSWSYASTDIGNYDSGGYLINGAYTQLADNGTTGSGVVSIGVTAGQTIGFRVFSFDGLYGAGVLTITNFSGPAAPAPGALALLGLAGLAGTRRRRRDGLSSQVAEVTGSGAALCPPPAGVGDASA